MKFLKFADAVIAIPVLLVLITLLLNVMCSGWSEGSMGGQCVLPFIVPFYAFFMGISFMAALTAILWLPVYIVFYILSTIDKARIVLKSGFRGLKENISGTVIWLIATLPLLLLPFF